LPPWQYTRHMPFRQIGSELPPTLITWRQLDAQLANDTVSFPLNQSATAAMTTVTDDKGFGNGSGFIVLLVCAVQSRRIYSSLLISASDRFDEPTCIHDYSNRLLVHGSLLLFWGNLALPFLQTPTHILLLLFSQESSPWLTFAVG